MKKAPDRTASALSRGLPPRLPAGRLAQRRCLPALAASIAVLLGWTAAAPRLLAQNIPYTWTGSAGDNSWTDSVNWSPSTGYPQDAGDTATFPGGALTTSPTLTDTTITVDNITLSSGAPVYTITVTGTAGTPASITFDATGVTNGSGLTQQFAITGDGTAPTSTTAPASFVFNSASTAGTGAAWTLTDGAAIYFNGSSSAGTGTTYTIDPTSAVYFAGSANLTGSSTAGNGTFVVNGTFDISNQTGGVTVGSIADTEAEPGSFYLGGNTLTTGADNTSTTVYGTINDGSAPNTTYTGTGANAGGSLTKIGTGTLTLAGANTYTGATTINDGVLLVNGSLAAGSAVTTNSGATLGGTGTVNGPVTIADGGTLTPGDGSAPGTLTVGSLTLNSSSNLNYYLGAPGVTGGGVNSLTTVNGDLTLAGTMSITAQPGFGIGTYEIIDYTGGLTNNTLTVGPSAPAGYTYTVDTTSTAGAVNLDVTSNGETVFWNGPYTTPQGAVEGGTGTWDNTTTNWTDAAGTVSGPYTGVTGVFEGTAGTVTLGDNIAFSDLEFYTTGYVINPDAPDTFSLTPSAGATIIVGSGVTATINANLVDPSTGSGSITISGAGTLVLGGTNTYSGPTTVNNGTLQAGSSGGFSPNSAFVIGSSSTLDINGYSPTIGSLAGSGTVTNSSTTPGTLTTGNDNTSTTYSGVITDNTAAGGTLTLTKIGTGTLTLTGTNTYTGGTNLANGGLFLNDMPASGVSSAIGTGTLTITSVTGSTTTLGSATQSQTIDNTVNVEGDFTVTTAALNSTTGAPGNFYFAGPVNLGNPSAPPAPGTAYTITGSTASGQVQFEGGITGLASDGSANVGVNFIGPTSSSSYAAFIYTGSTPNTYTGLSTVGANAFLVLEQSISNSAVIGNILVNPGGSLDLLASDQTATTITVTVNSGGINDGGIQFQGFELQTNSDTIGTLNGNSTGTVGIGTGYLTVSNGAFAGDIVDSVTSGTIEALEEGYTYGGLIMVGPGTLNLSGVNSYSGATYVESGTLQAGSSTGFSPNSAVTVDTGAILDVNGFNTTIGSLTGAGIVTNSSTTPGILITGFDGTNTSFTGTLEDGAGTLGLVKTGAGTFTIYNSTYSGPTDVVQGTLQAATTTAFSSRSAFVVDAPGIVDLNGFNNSIGSLAGTGTVTNMGATPVVLTTGLDNTNTNFSGTLQDGASTIALLKTGTGAMILSSPNTFSGGTVLQNGALVIESILALGSGNVTVNGGTLQVGGAANDIEVGGNYKQTGGGELALRIGGTAVGTFDRLAVVGTASLSGRLEISSLNGFIPPRGSDYTIVTAAGGVTGRFGQVTGDLADMPLLHLSVDYLPNEVVLDFGGTSFAGLPNLTPNEKAVATALDNVTLNTESNKALDYLESLPVKSLPGAFDRIAPEEYGTIYQISVSSAKMQAISVENRLDQVHATHAPFGAEGAEGPEGPVGPPDGKSASAPSQPNQPNSGIGVFANFTGEVVSIGNSYNAAGYDFDSGGVTFGGDYRFNENFVLGALFNYTRTAADLVENGRLDADGFRGGVYASLFGGGAYVNGFLGAGYNDYDMQRTGLDATVRGDSSGGEFNALIQTGYDAHRDGLTYGPVGSFQYTYTGLSSLQEQGSLDPLNINSSREQSIRSNIGARVTYDWHIGSYVLSPQIRATWQHEFGDVIDSTTASMVFGSPDFTVTSSPIGRDSLLLDVGFTLTISPRIAAYLFYDGELARANYTANNLLLGMRVEF